MEITLNGYYTLILATLVLLLGRFLVKRIKFLEDFNIPEPVAGGLVAAVANMQAVTDRYLPSPKAFLIVPMVGAFFVDIVNATILQIFTKLPFM